MPEQPIKVRTKFIACLTVILMLPFIFLIALKPSLILYLAGIVIPAICLSAYCFYTKQKEFVGLIPLSAARKIYATCLIVGLISYYFQGAEPSIAWFITSMVFFRMNQPYERPRR